MRRARLEIRESLGKVKILMASRRFPLDMKMREIVAIRGNDHKKQLNCFVFIYRLSILVLS